MTCPNCGRDVPDGTHFCDGCGYRFQLSTIGSDFLERETTYEPPKKRKRSGWLVLVILLIIGLGVAIGLFFKSSVFDLIENGDLNILSLRIRLSPEVLNETTKVSWINYSNWDRKSASYNALQYSIVKDKGLETVALLIEKGADVNSVSTDGESPLSLAAEIEKLDYLEVLLANGADVNFRNAEGYTPLRIAAEYDNENMIKVLLDAGADPDVMYGVLIGDESVDIPLLMYEAVLNSNQTIVRALIDAGADVNKEDPYGYTTLERCLMQNLNLGMIMVLVENGADLEHIDKYGDTPLCLAIEEKVGLGIIKYLVESGANVKQLDARGRTPLMLAIINDMEFDVIKCLIDANSSVIDYSYEGWSTLQQAIISGSDLEIIKYIVYSGADLSVKTKYGSDIISLAEQYASEDVKEFIELAVDAYEFKKTHILDEGNVFSDIEESEAAEKYLQFFRDYDINLVFITADSSLLSVESDSYREAMEEKYGAPTSKRITLLFSPTFSRIWWSSYYIEFGEDDSHYILDSVGDEYWYGARDEALFAFEEAARAVLKKDPDQP